MSIKFEQAKTLAAKMGVLECANLKTLQQLADTYYVGTTLVNSYLNNLRFIGCPKPIQAPPLRTIIDNGIGIVSGGNGQTGGGGGGGVTFGKYIPPKDLTETRVDEFGNVVTPVMAGYDDLQKWIIPVGLVVFAWWAYKQI